MLKSLRLGWYLGFRVGNHRWNCYKAKKQRKEKKEMDGGLGLGFSE